MKITNSIFVALSAMAFLGCSKDGAEVLGDAASQMGKETRLNLEKPVLEGDNLEKIYRQAVFDFADYQVKNPSVNGKVPSRILGQSTNIVQVFSDSGLDSIRLEPGQFAGVDFKTPLGSLLTNVDPENLSRLRDDPIGLHSIFYSESKQRLQVVLGWAGVTGGSWAFLYDIDDHGVMLIRKAEEHGSSFFEDWIE